jgi:hypothetical protein
VIKRFEHPAKCSWYEVDPVRRVWRNSRSNKWYPTILNSLDEIIKDVQDSGHSLGVFSCCGGKGYGRWNGKIQQWECSDCGNVLSNDPNYLGSSVKKIQQELEDWAAGQQSSKKCVCGSAAVGSPKHSSWCDLYKADQ